MAADPLLTKVLLGFTCDVCGEQATSMAKHTEERIHPGYPEVRGKEPLRLSSFYAQPHIEEVPGPTKFGCDEHPVHYECKKLDL